MWKRALNIETGYCPQNHVIKATVIWEPNDHCQIFDFGRSHARMINFQKRYYVETVTNNENNSAHQRNAQMYTSCFQDHLYDDYAISRFEVLTKPIYRCKEDHPYYATQ